MARRPGGTALAGDLAGLTLAPGLHSAAAAVANTGTVILDGGGDPSSVFVFKVGGALTMAAGARVTLTNGATAARVFWQVNGAADIGAGASFAGTLMSLDAAAVGARTVVNGRVLARNGAISLDANEVYGAPPAVTVTGGAEAITTDTTPTISGTTDVEAPGLVTVTIAGQTLTATPADGAWSVTSAILANGTYPVVASVRDGAGNVGSATQQLTVDTVLPLVAIDGGPARTTNDPTPTISGTSDVAPGTVVRVAVAAQALTALVQLDGTWNVAPAALREGDWTVTATVTDPAGNDGTDSQQLTVDVAAPAVTITGGESALTDDATPEISGTADVAAGTTVTVTVAVQTLIGVVGADGTWSVSAARLPDGPHLVRMSVSDTAGNAAAATQTLTVDTVAPAVAIDGGAAVTTDDERPTIAGTSDAAPGTTVAVSIAGHTLTTLVQGDGTWNTTPAAPGAGTWPVVASAADPAGNVGSARQALTVVAAEPGTGPAGPAGPTGPSGPAGPSGE
ncbi:MAG TPA: Ig-like domain-containing protein, partial [Conexibacter sp.]|nr:Ig-like domain-containing protein [Conexibacter sp.]